MKAILTVETDWDFSLVFDGELFTDSEIELKINSIDHLKSIQLKGPFGADYKPEKLWEWDEAMKQILANPLQNFSNTGGNRGVEWNVINENGDWDEDELASNSLLETIETIENDLMDLCEDNEVMREAVKEYFANLKKKA